MREFILGLGLTFLGLGLAAFVAWLALGPKTRRRRERALQIVAAALFGLGGVGLTVAYVWMGREAVVRLALDHPSEVGLSADGRYIYVLDTENDRLLALDPRGEVVHIAGTGQRGFSGDGGDPTMARLNFPDGLAVAPDSRVFMADSGNRRIRVIEDGVISTYAGVGPGQPGRLDENVPAVIARLGYVEGLALGPDGALYVADAEFHRIRRIGPDGFISTFAGTGEAGFSGDGGPAELATLNHPEAVAVTTDGTVYIADTYNNRIRAVSSDGTIRTVASGGPASCLESPKQDQPFIYCPQGLGLGAENVLLVADTFNHRILRVSDDGDVNVVAGTGEAGFSGDGGPARLAELAFPQGLAVATDGSIIFADRLNGRIRRIDPRGRLESLLHEYSV